jgi:L-fuculose-phosphate aldolase
MPFSEPELREQLVKCMKNLHGKGLITGAGGNASLRIERTEEVLITPSALYKGELRGEDVMKIDLGGNVIEGDFKPSTEWPFHTAIYRKRHDVNAIVHTHSPMTMGLALAGKKIEPVTVESIVMLADVPILEFRYPESKDLGELVGENIQGRRALILQNHGVIAVGQNLLEALTTIEVLEEVSTTTFVASHFGGAKLIPTDQIELIKKLHRI